MTATMSPTETEEVNTLASLPFQPLWDMAKHRARINPMALTGFTLTMFADMIGFNERAASRWRDKGTIPWVSADEAATSLGLHPSNIWGFDDWYNVKGDLAEIASGKRDRAINRALDQVVEVMNAEMVDHIVAEAASD